jgi:DNA-directed RNA polymerase subunit RPC12/RpoP
MDQDLCVVCGEELDELNSAVCGACGGRYHLVVRTDMPGKDCGDVSLNEAYLALQYACANCLGEGPATPSSAETSAEKPEESPRRPTRSERARASRSRRRYRKR